ncbi:MAG: integration host factor subunit alpha [Proteobacteria bacterium]|uniref:Integration host factor subunit alpha n=1 Tax=Candidatus Avisuccinivibrio stercorigallinarum TaxID=2840704 RepID=A0A9D9GTV6_9GAMM|nr:integration host factor subunit alpha [Candidatus Avisuccinivibrio stercorigallinarum]
MSTRTKAPALVRADLAERLVYRLGFPKSEAMDFIDNMFKIISKSLCEGEDVRLTGFGNFEVREKKERPGRNPRTGEHVTIAARRVVTFKTGNKLKGRIDNW